MPGAVLKSEIDQDKLVDHEKQIFNGLLQEYDQMINILQAPKGKDEIIFIIKDLLREKERSG